MFKLNLKIALRNLWKNKGYTFINIAGLSVGLAGCLLIFLFIRYELSFDDHFAKKDRIYRVVSTFRYVDGMEYQSGVPVPLPLAMRNDFSQMEKVAAIHSDEGVVSVRFKDEKDIKKKERVYYTEPQFFEIFDCKWLEGSPQQALASPNTAALSEKAAKVYFGTAQNAIGKTIRFQNKQDFKIMGVFMDQPDNSSFPLDVVVSYRTFASNSSIAKMTNWSSVSSGSQCYVLLKDGIKPADLNTQLKQFVEKYHKDNTLEKSSEVADHLLQPLKDLHRSEQFYNYRSKTTPIKQIIGLGIIGIFLLITACINFINLATAQAVGRAKEIGVRKVMGSQRRQLILQFLTETVTVTIIALLIACVLTELALPAMKGLFQAKISLSLFSHPSIFLFMLLQVIVVSFLAGFYPALVMSGFNPALAIKSKVGAIGKGKVNLRRVLVIVQFAITVVLIVGTIVVIRQMSYMRHKSLGFNTNAIALVNVPFDSLAQVRLNTLQQRLTKLAGVEQISFCATPPSSTSYINTSFTFDNSSKSVGFNVTAKPADENYYNTFGIKIIAGKTYTKSDTAKEYMVNETLLRKLNVPNPGDALGKKLNLNGHTGIIIGVVKDFNDGTLHKEIAPIALYTDKRNYSTIAIKMGTRDMAETMKNVESEWNSVFPEYVYEAKFMDDQINSFYKTEQIMGSLFKVFAGVVIFISFIGLFGLISFVAVQRTREVAIRKVLGASSFELVKMLNGSFLIMVLLANLLAWPVAYLLVSKWLAGFAYRVDLSIWPFAAALFISMSITIITVSFRSYRTAKTNPIDALKYE